jgi:gliding motility-associated-like protein
VLGQPVSTDTVLTVFAPGTGSCDTLWTVSAQVLPVVETDLFFEACTGDTVQTQGVGLPAGAVQTFVYTGVTGCDSTVHVTVGVLDSVLTHVTLFACADQTVSWNGQELAPGAVASVVFSTPDGCDSTVIAAVMSLPGPTVDLPSEVVLPVGQTLQLSPNVTGQGPFAYSWQPAALVDCPTCMSAIAQVPSDVWIALTVTDGQGCRAADSVWVRLSNPEDTCGIYVPNAFLPDDDGRNDFFYPSAGPCVQAVSYLRVYDRWGELVFERTDFPPDTEHLGWNGRFNDNDAPAAVYVWVIEIRTLDGIRRIFTGDLTLLR